MSHLTPMTHGVLSYLVLACASAAVGYYFARKRTEYEVGYRHRVEVAESVQGMVIPLVEEFDTALEYVRAPGPSGELPVEEIERSVDGLEKYVEQQEMWLDRRSSTALGELIASFRAHRRMVDLLPRRYDDPGFERAHERATVDLDEWLRAELPAAREELDDAFRGMLGVKKWRHRLKC